jgi:hypothetical protein
MMKPKPLVIVLAAVLAAGCGGPQTPPGGAGPSNTEPGDGAGNVRDTRTELERRRDAACEALGPRVTTCAVEDARAQLAAGKVSQHQFDQDTAPAVQRKNTEEFIAACRKPEYSSRQIRVLEVCPREETACDPLFQCLDNLNAPETK